ncbi:lipase [Kriegella sp. EG-1]|nr:lipase [Flavobacteriaceae bacterium EG-1]
MNKIFTYFILSVLIFGCKSYKSEVNSKNSVVSVVAENTAEMATKKQDEWWLKRHELIISKLNPNSKLILVGNSIFHSLDNKDRTEVWQNYLDAYNTINMGISGDRTENVIWRLENGSIENINPSVALVLIGTNNTDGNHYLNISTPEELAAGIDRICSILLNKLPNTEILLMGILPYGNKPNHRNNINIATNKIISKFPENNRRIHYVDIGHVYYNDGGTVRSDLMPDYLHPNTEGHMLMFKVLNDRIKELSASVKK